MGDFNKQVERNFIGIQREKEGKVDEAVELYEANVRENFDGNHPYDRLAIIYRKRDQIEDEIRVLENGILGFLPVGISALCLSLKFALIYVLRL